WAQARRAGGRFDVRRLGRPGRNADDPDCHLTPDDPVASGFARSIDRPSGNITAMWFDYDALVDKRLEFLKLPVPPVPRVGVIVNPDDPTDAVSIRRLTAATRALGMTLEQFEVSDVTKLDVMAATIGRAGVEALLIGDGPTILSARTDIIAMVARLRLPAMYGFREFADAGGQPAGCVSANGQIGGQDSKGRPPGRAAVRAAGPLRIDRKSQDSQSDRANDPGLVRSARRRGDRVKAKELVR